MYKVLKIGIFVRIGEANSPNWSWMVATQVIYIPLGLALRFFFKDILVLKTCQYSSPVEKEV